MSHVTTDDRERQDDEMMTSSSTYEQVSVHVIPKRPSPLPPVPTAAAAAAGLASDVDEVCCVAGSFRCSISARNSCDEDPLNRYY